jgi:DNA sulfur modification protein DndE
MSSKLKLSKEASDHLNILSMRFSLKRNIICRIAVGRSLSEPTSVEGQKTKDNLGFEFNRYTLTGDFDEIFKAIICQHAGKKLDDDLYFSDYFRNHLERGLDLLYNEFKKVNSPTEFLINLFDGG